MKIALQSVLDERPNRLVSYVENLVINKIAVLMIYPNDSVDYRCAIVIMEEKKCTPFLLRTTGTVCL